MRVLVVDDSTLFRKVVRDALAHDPDVEVVGSAANGRVALEKIEQLKPDVVTLDLEMPEIDGLEVLRRLRDRPDAPSVIMVSAWTETGATLTAQALRLGAFDFILKPSAASIQENLASLSAELLPKIRLLAECTGGKRTTIHKPRESAKPDESHVVEDVPAGGRTLPVVAPEVVAIGISTGGPAALAEMLPKLPADLPVPIVLVQHMPPKFTRSLADDLDRSCPLHVQEAQGGQRLRPGEVYVAPGGRQMKVVQSAARPTIEVTDDPPEKSCKPAVDYLFRSLAHSYGDRVLAVIMTGMGDDGTLGCRLLKRRGSRIIAQDEASCVVYGMPRQVIEAGLADAVCPLSEIHEAIVQSVSSIGPRRRNQRGEQGSVLCR